MGLSSAVIETTTALFATSSAIGSAGIPKTLCLLSIIPGACCKILEVLVCGAKFASNIKNLNWNDT